MTRPPRAPRPRHLRPPSRRRPPRRLRSSTCRSCRSPASARPPRAPRPRTSAAALAGSGGRFDSLALVDGDATRSSARSASTGQTSARVVRFDDVRSLTADLAKNRKRLAFLRADAVGPEVRALGWGGKALFGVDRVKKLADWPLTAPLPAPADGRCLRPGHHVDAVRGRRHPARSWGLSDAQGQGRRTTRSMAGRRTSPVGARTAPRWAGTCRTRSGRAMPAPSGT